MLTLKALMYTEDPKYKLAGPIGTIPQEPWHPESSSSMIFLTNREVRTSASWKTARTEESFDHQEEEYFPP